MQRADSGAKSAIIVPLKDVLEANPGSLDNLYAVDTILTPAPGKGLVLPKDKTRVVDFNPDLDSLTKDKMVEDALLESKARFTFLGGVESSAQEGLDTHIKTNLAPQLNTYSKLHSGLYSASIEDTVLEGKPNVHGPLKHAFSKSIDASDEEVYKYGKSGVKLVSELSDNAKARLFDNDFFISTKPAASLQELGKKADIGTTVRSTSTPRRSAMGARVSYSPAVETVGDNIEKVIGKSKALKGLLGAATKASAAVAEGTGNSNALRVAAAAVTILKKKID
jgi:hypothetical protein